MPRPYAGFSSDQILELALRSIASNNQPTLDALLKELEEHRDNNRAKQFARRIRNSRNNGIEVGPDAIQMDLLPKPMSPRRLSNRQPSGNSDAPGNHPPTPEQRQAIDAFFTGKNIKINAFAGSGKTSTLIQISHSTTKQGLYLAFNKKIVEDSSDSFPPNVSCSTIHSLAYRSVVTKYRGGAKMTEAMNALKIAELFKLADWDVYKGHVLTAHNQGQLILNTVRKYCQSADKSVANTHVPQIRQLSGVPDKVISAVVNWVAKAASALWQLMVQVETDIPLGHDGYLKIWALQQPQISAEFILVDEAQDTNPVVLEVLEKQNAQLVLVGDRHQQIYEWRGAINAMEKLPVAHSTNLTLSFRFGEEIAEAANAILKLLGESLRVKGNPAKAGRIGDIANPKAVLARTNASTLKAIIDALDASKKPHLVGGIDDLRRLLNGVTTLKSGQPSEVPEFFGFKNWQELLLHVRNEETHELQMFVNLVEARGERQLLWALGRCVEEHNADICVSTVHKAKGRQWPSVRIFDDFFNSTPSTDDKKLDDAELRLLYVALTRAKDELEIPKAVRFLLENGKKMPKSRVTNSIPN